jgi:ABC-2 type transport system permease protein
MSSSLESLSKTQKRIQDSLARAESMTSWYGTWMLFRREIRRFVSILGQSVISPVLSTMLYFVVFGFSLGKRIDTIQGVPYIDFIVPGLVMMSLVMNSFFNSAFSFFLGKIHGSIVDLLASPIGGFQLMLAYCGAAVTRGVLTGSIIWFIASLMGAHTIHDPLFTAIFMIGSSAVFGLLGLLIAILAKDFEHINFLPSFILMPMTFLGGVFYSIEMLPDFWATVSRFNPILYIINGLRYGMIGVSDVPVAHGLLFLAASITILAATTLYLLKTGKRVRE